MLGHSDNSPSELIGPRLAFVFGFASMFVFPAIPIGNTQAIDATLILTAALILLRPAVIFGPGLPLILLVIVPLVQSSLIARITGAIDPPLMAKTVVAYFLCVLPLLAGCELMRSGRLREVLIGVSFALPVHALVAIYQIISFEHGFFPLFDLMATNPGMAMSPEIAAINAQLIQRPFGLFAEPSAMTACVGPWLVLIVAFMANQDRWLALRINSWILALAVTAGFFLMAASRSGQAVINLAGIALALVASLAGKRNASTHRGRFWALVAVATLLVATAISLKSGFSAETTSSGETYLEDRTGGSWAGRLTSIGFVSTALLHDVGTFLFGVGAGQSYSMIQSHARFARDLPPGVDTVWSVTGSYAIETGVFGLLCIGAIAWLAAVSIWQSTERSLGVVCALIWLTAVLFATSYAGQPSLWFFLAVLLNWSKQLGLREPALAARSTGVLATR